ncbi:MAG: phytanoyl-CoA dioxygenase family protein [Armatimonadetes bacterium]|nr:phytanoyl-CoA dioxygenase family protein [Armatimonadota bacterium]
MTGLGTDRHTWGMMGNDTTEAGLPAAQVEAFHQNGFLHLPHVFTPAEVAVWHEECERLLASELIHDDNVRTRFRVLPDGGRVLEKYDPVVDVSPVFDAVACDERILGPIRQLFDDGALLFKDKLIFKPAGAGGYSAHQDFTWWQPFPHEKLLSVMVAVDGADAGNGALELMPGRHHRHLVPVGEMRALTEAEIESLQGEWQQVETSPGDILIFHCLTPHRSGQNTSSRSRRQFYPSYSAASYGDLYELHYEHYRWYVERNLSAEEKARLYFE